MRHAAKAVGATLLVAAAILAPRGVVAQPPGDPAKMPPGPGNLLPAAIDELCRRLDANQDGHLNADELPEPLRSGFGRIDLDDDGYVGPAELGHALAADSARAAARGEVMANRLVAVVDDFIVDVYHNGRRVPDAKRSLLVEVFGATVERIDVEVRQGDWLVFNVVNNRLRWGGVRYFAVAGIKEGSGTTFATEPTTGRWTRCDDPSQVAAFIADPRFLDDQLARGIERRWDQGDTLMNRHADGWHGSAIWGEGRNTWIRFVAR
jgi:hypothetical protein